VVALNGFVSYSARRTKQIVGAVAIVLIAVFAVLLFIRILDLITFLIAALLTSFVANLIFRKVGEPTRQVK
jgi:hypothetical protein